MSAAVVAEKFGVAAVLRVTTPFGTALFGIASIGTVAAEPGS